MAAMALSFGLILAGCPTEDDSPKGEYHLKWAALNGSVSSIKPNLSSFSITPTAEGTDWFLVTGSDATSLYDGFKSNKFITGEGDSDGSFEECRDFSKDSKPAPDGLKTAIGGNKAKAPLAGVFDAGGGKALLFYITKN